MDVTFDLALAVTAATPLVVVVLAARMLKRGIEATVVPSVIAAVTLRIITVITTAALTHHTAASSSIGQYLLRSHNPYFGNQVRSLLLNEAVGLVVAVLLWGFLEFVRRRREATMDRGEPLLIVSLCLIAGWPNFLLAVVGTLLLAILGSIVLAIFRRSLEHRIRLGVAAVCASFAVAFLSIVVPSTASLLDRLRL